MLGHKCFGCKHVEGDSYLLHGTPSGTGSQLRTPDLQCLALSSTTTPMICAPAYMYTHPTLLWWHGSLLVCFGTLLYAVVGRSGQQDAMHESAQQLLFSVFTWCDRGNCVQCVCRTSVTLHRCMCRKFVLAWKIRVMDAYCFLGAIAGCIGAVGFQLFVKEVSTAPAGAYCQHSFLEVPVRPAEIQDNRTAHVMVLPNCVISR